MTVTIGATATAQGQTADDATAPPPPSVGASAAVAAPAAPPVAQPAPAAPPGGEESDRTAFNSVFLEIAGNGGFYSVNYDRLLSEMFSVRVGIMYISMGASASSGGTTASASASYLAVPLLGNFLYGTASHKFEGGAGLTIWSFGGGASWSSENTSGTAEASAIVPMATAVVGYRYIPEHGGFTFRAGITPLISLSPFDVFPWGGISLGGAF